MSPEVQHQFVTFEPHAGVDAVARREDIAAAGHAMGQSVADRIDALLIGAGIEFAAVDIADQADLLAITFFHFGDIHSRLRIDGMQGMGMTLDKLIENRHDIAVGMFDGVKNEAMERTEGRRPAGQTAGEIEPPLRHHRIAAGQGRKGNNDIRTPEVFTNERRARPLRLPLTVAVEFTRVNYEFRNPGQK